MKKSSKKKCVVIGGGLAGLASAAQLAYRGYSVTLIEKNAHLGGRARVHRAKGFVFDMGPSWYMMPEVIESFFTSLGKKSSSYFSLVELGTKYRLFTDTKAPIDIVSNLKKNLDFFESLEPGSAKRVSKIIEKTSIVYALSVELLQRKYDSLFSLFSFEVLTKGVRILAAFNPFQSYERFINRSVTHPLIRKILQFHTVFLGGSPKNTPALYSILVASDFKGKIWYPKGGVGKLVQALEKVCEELGVTIYTNEAVTSVEIDSATNCIQSVTTDKQVHPSDVVITTADYAYFDTTIVPSKYAEYSKEYWDSRDYAISSVLLYLGVSKKIPELQHHNFYFQEDWDVHFSTIQNSSEFPQKPCFYICAPSVTDSKVAPKGSENLFVLVPVSVKTKTTHLDAYVNHVLEHIETTIGVKITDAIEYKKVFAQEEFKDVYNAYKGNALGISHTLFQSVFLRPRMKSSKIANLFFAGQFTQPGIGVPMVLLSGKYVAKEVEKYCS